VTSAAAPGGRDIRPTAGILFTDLDGTLLDHDTYRASPEALRLVAELAAAGIWTVPVTSKTAAEVEELERTGVFAPMAVAEGGAVVLDSQRRARVVGRPRRELIQVLVQLRGEGWRMRGMSEMSVGEVGDRTGLAADAASRAMERMASEPFVLEVPHGEPWESSLRRRAHELGAELSRGGRFWHLTGRGVDKGTGVAAVLERIDPERRLVTGAVGDAWNDLPMLAAVDVGFLLGAAVDDRDLPPVVRRIEQRGPAGFSRAARCFRERCRRG
jgi:mannosyl-3-phosphoglycerate phosphatase